MSNLKSDKPDLTSGFFFIKDKKEVIYERDITIICIDTMKPKTVKHIQK